ncbi:hypothetical protein SB748_25300 [Rhizobium sp. SIMBA_035]
MSSAAIAVSRSRAAARRLRVPYIAAGAILALGGQDRFDHVVIIQFWDRLHPAPNDGA